MIKIIALLISLIGSGLLLIPCHTDNVFLNILIYLGFFIGIILVYVIVFFVACMIVTIPVDTKNPPKKHSKFYRKIFGRYVNVGLSLFGVRLHVSGMDKIPKDGVFLATSNHLSNVDPFVMDSILHKRELIFVSKESLFRIPFFGKIIQGSGFLKLFRTANSKNDLKEVLRGIKWLKEGQCSIGVYPEGTRNKTYPNPIMGEFHHGTFQMAMKSKTPILVCSIKGTEKINDGLLFKVHDVYFNVLDCLYYDDYKDMTSEEISDKVYKMTLEGIEKKPTPDYTRLY